MAPYGAVPVLRHLGAAALRPVRMTTLLADRADHSGARMAVEQ